MHTLLEDPALSDFFKDINIFFQGLNLIFIHFESFNEFIEQSLVDLMIADLGVLLVDDSFDLCIIIVYLTNHIDFTLVDHVLHISVSRCQRHLVGHGVKVRQPFLRNSEILQN